jgi:RNA polymerase sigma-70 factor, ECF subfamily
VFLMTEQASFSGAEADLTREEEAALVARAKSDAQVFGQLYELHVRRIYSYVYYRTGNHHDAEDLTARVFFRALEHVGRYQERGAPFSAWLYRIAHNAVANWHRDKRWNQTVALEDLAGQLEQGDDPFRIAERSEVQAQLLRLVRHLPPERQQLLVLKFVERYSNQEIGEIMGRTEGAIKSLYHRTLTALRKELGDEWEGFGD